MAKKTLEKEPKPKKEKKPVKQKAIEETLWDVGLPSITCLKYKYFETMYL